MANTGIEGGAPAGTMTVIPATTGSISPQDRSLLEAKAGDIIITMQQNPADREFAASIMNLGAEAQQRSGRKVELLKGRVGSLLNELDGENAQIPKDLVRMRMLLDQINPHATQKAGFFSRLLGRVPGIGERLKEIAIRYESVQTQVDAIVEGLRNGKDALLKDNMSLEDLYADLQEEQANVQKNAYLGEVLLQKLEEMAVQTLDPNSQRKIQSVMHAVALRVQDLRTMEQVNMQFFISIDMTCENNNLLSQAVDRTLSVTRNVITIGLSIATALVRQKKVLEATRSTQEYAGNILANNAAALRQQTAEIQSLYSDPVLALDFIQKSYNDLIGAIDDVEKAKRAGIESAKKGIAEISEMSRKLAEKVDTVRSDRLPDSSNQVRSIEA